MTVFEALGVVIASRAELLAAGATSKMLTAAVRFGHLVRLRRDHYALPGTEGAIQRAVRVGGAVTCVTALELYGVFTFDTSKTHVALTRDMSRIRGPLRRESFRHTDRQHAVLHWWNHECRGDGKEIASLVDALAHAIRCQRPELAIASLDNALHLGLLDVEDLDEVFARVPEQYRGIRGRLNGRAEAGQESVLRILADDEGYRVDIQVTFPGIGRADMLVEDCLILEADSRAHHDGWEKHVHDRGRDLAFAALGYPSLRPAFNHTMYYPDQVRAALRGLLESPRLHA